MHEDDALRAVRAAAEIRNRLSAVARAEIDARLGDRDAAIAAIELSDRLGAAEDVINYAITHGARALLAAADGEYATAERWSRSALEFAERTDFVMARAGARMILGEALAEARRLDEAQRELHAALELYTAKGDRPRTAHAQALLASLDAGTG